MDYQGDLEYADSRLSDSWMRDKSGSLIYVRRVRVEGVHYMRPKAENFQLCRLEDLNTDPVPLGFVNWGKEAIYVSRIPTRSWKQGLRSNSVYTSKAVNIPSLLNSFNLDRTVRGIYPTVVDGLELVTNSEMYSVAFSRNFAFTQAKGLSKGKYLLLYKNKTVGTLFSENNKEVLTTLAPEYKFLQESLDGEYNVGHYA